MKFLNNLIMTYLVNDNTDLAYFYLSQLNANKNIIKNQKDQQNNNSLLLCILTKSIFIVLITIVTHKNCHLIEM